MASRKDLLKAQSFITQRLVASFVNRDPDSPIGPLRRVATATFVGVMLGVLIVAGTGLVARFRGTNSDSWRNDSGVLIGDVNAGVLFVYYRSSTPGPDGEGEPILLPMADVASARLAIGSAQVTSVRTDRLQGIRQDVMRGIPNAPRQLPPVSQMNPYPLRFCSTANTDEQGRYLTMEIGKEATNTPVTVGDSVAVEVRAVETDPLTGQEVDRNYLVVDGAYHQIADDIAAQGPLLGATPVNLGRSAWLSTLDVGHPIQPFNLPNFGGVPTSRQAQPDMMIGSVALVESTTAGGPERYYIQLDDGLVETSFVNMITELRAQGRSEPIKITAEIADRFKAPNADPLTTPGLNTGRPRSLDSNTQRAASSICLTYLEPTSDDRPTPVITVGAPTIALPPGVADRRPMGNRVDYVDVDPLHGVLFQNSEILEANADDGPTSLFTNGMLYAIPDRPSRVALGYGPGEPFPVVRVPPSLLDLLTDPDPARQQVTLSRTGIYPPLPADFGGS